MFRISIRTQYRRPGARGACDLVDSVMAMKHQFHVIVLQHGSLGESLAHLGSDFDGASFFDSVYTGGFG
jgi:hypothetical protein